jgi:signal transduction histidine kinase
MNGLSDRSWPELFEKIALGILILDRKEQRILWQNRAMRDLFPAAPLDYPRAKECFLASPQPDGQEKTDPQTIDLDGKTIGYTVYFMEKDVCLILAMAVSEKERQRKLSQSNSLIHVLDYLFFSLAHELGNPINSIKMTLEVLINNFAEYSTATKLEYLGNLHDEFKRLEELLRAIRSFNMFEHLSIKPTDVGAVLENLMQLLGDEIEKKRLAVKMDIEPGKVLAASDPRALHQVLLNLTSNAIDALAASSDPRVSFKVRQSKGQVQITINDNGCGIPDHRKKELFLPFFSGKSQGVGLGLSIVKKLLTQMNGTIEINSRQNLGTEVRIALPAISTHEQ